ncbi:hypothetical protein AOC05_13280 [Arthrobacter alpinus]|uniref:Uncharacterized protein n=1 Tax=Arthrobacter alpinus TaxID=656366 RepID=A0A0M3UGN9_9MICC|nr:hypothetical protein AOC05_13280 [Arthrobacter alpinus]
MAGQGVFEHKTILVVDELTAHAGVELNPQALAVIRECLHGSPEAPAALVDQGHRLVGGQLWPQLHVDGVNKRMMMGGAGHDSSWDAVVDQSVNLNQLCG